MKIARRAINGLKKRGVCNFFGVGGGGGVPAGLFPTGPLCGVGTAGVGVAGLGLVVDTGAGEVVLLSRFRGLVPGCGVVEFALPFSKEPIPDSVSVSETPVVVLRELALLSFN